MFALLAAGLIAALSCLPHHVAVGWSVFGGAAVVATGVGVWIHPPAYRIPLWWGVSALGCVLAAQTCVLAGVRPSRATDVTVIDLFAVAAGVAAVGALFGAISRQVRGWDGGFLIDVIIVVASLTATVWLYLIAPYVMRGPPAPVLDRLTLAAYPAGCLVLVTLSVMLLMRVGWRRRGVALMALGVAGLVFSNMFMLVTRVNDATAAGFWRNLAAAGAGWLLFQACWGAAGLHKPDPRCPSSSGRWPQRPMTATRLVVLLAVTLADPVTLSIQTAQGRVTQLGHFPIVGGTVFLAVIVRLSFVGAEHLRSVQRLHTLLEAQRQLSGAQSAIQLAQVTADVAGSMLGGRGEACVALFTTDKPRSASWHASHALTRFDPAQWRSTVADWVSVSHEAGAQVRFLRPDEVAYLDGVKPATALACPINTARSQLSGMPLGILVVAGPRGQVAGSVDPLALLAGQVGESLERIGMTRRTAQRHLKTVTANIADAILIADDDKVVRYSNAAADVLFGDRIHQDIALSELVGSEHAEALCAPTGETLPQWALPGGSQIVEAHVDDRRADPTVEGFVITLRDVTKLNTLEHDLRRRATHDQETGLENRFAFAARLARIDGNEDVERGVLAVAIDDLAEITEESGAESAHRVVEEMARRLARAFEAEQPAVARIDASTLAILLSGAPELPAADVLLAKVRWVGSEPVGVDSRAVTASVSGGFGSRHRGRHPTEQVLEDALLALHAAQRNSPRGLVAFTPALRTSRREQAELRAGINEALAEGAFSLHYQPVVNLEDRRPVSAEALIRWRKPDGTSIQPDTFIPFAEQTGQIVPLGTWVLRRAAEDYARWPRHTAAGGLRDLKVNVNVSPVQLQEPEFLTRLRALLSDSALPPTSLVLEVTESGIVDNVEALLHARTMGIGVAMDDFGTGYSSLSSLRRLPISTVKIDKAFVDGIATDPVQYALVEGIVRLADELGLITVAEGVEDEAQHARLLDAGCRCGQGYLYSRPIPSAEFEQWLRAATAE